MIDIQLELYNASIEAIEQKTSDSDDVLQRAYRGSLFKIDMQTSPVPKPDLLKVITFLQ